MSRRTLRSMAAGAVAPVLLAGAPAFADIPEPQPLPEPAPSMGREDLGAVGPVYPIAEANMLEWIEQQLLKRERSGELDQLKEEAIEQALDSLENPEPTELPTLDYDTVQYHDPSIMAARDIRDHEGQVIVEKGTTVNPLDTITMTREMLFFDGRDRRQVAWARERMEEARDAGKVPRPILVAGSYLELMREWEEQVFYDQDGALIRQLGIGAVPVRVYQEPGKRVLTLEYESMTGRGPR